MAIPVVALAGLCVGALGTGAVVLGAVAAELSVGPVASPGVAAPLPAGSLEAAVPGAGLASVSPPVLSPALAAAAQDAVAGAGCPGLDWTLLAGAALVDPNLGDTLASVAAALCTAPPSGRPLALAALLPGPTQGQVALVLAQSLRSDPALGTAAATAITFAASNLGAPYRWGGTGPGGFDCSGLTQAAYRAAGVALPRVAQDQFDAGPRLAPGMAVLPGDLLFFGSGPSGVSHVGIAIGAGAMIDAPHTGAFVRVEPAPVTPGAFFGSDVLIGVSRPAP